MSALLDHLARRIAAEGPLGVDDYMAEVLGHPEHGYYMTGDPLGRGGDFITAPEVSQMFGELIGLWCALVWTTMGRPASIKLVELGPGRGTLMADALRAAAGVAGFIDAVAVHLVETSPALATRQRRNLSTVAPPVHWHDCFADVPDGPLIVVANEFLDALPIQQFQKTAGGWSERRIAVHAGRLAWTVVPATDGPAIDAAEGVIVEASPARDEAVREIAQRIDRAGGAAVIVDYGHVRSAPGDTLQAVKDHRFHDVLARPGEADVTAHVDFERTAEVARAAGAAVHGPVTQGAFLQALGIETRAGMLARAASRGEAARVRAELRRLIRPSEMGDLFKVLAMTPAGTSAPDGFMQRTVDNSHTTAAPTAESA